MRILRVSSSLYPYKIGGIGVHVNSLSIEQSTDGNDITVFTCLPKQSSKSAIVHANTPLPYVVRFFKRDIDVAGNPVSFGIFFEIMRNRHTFNLIHAHSHLFLPTVMCAITRRIGSSPLVITNHGTFSQAVPSWLQNLYSHTIGVWTLNSADRVICYTKEAQKEMLELGVNPHKIHIVHNGIYLNKFLPISNFREHTGIHVLWVGRLTAGKGLKYLIKSFEVFLARYPDSVLSIAGEGQYQHMLSDYIANNHLSGNIVLLGGVSYDCMPDLYASADMLVFTSISEGAPRVIYEAMASGVPIVCTDLPQLLNIIPECGIIVPMCDAEATTEAMCTLAGDPELRSAYGKRGRELAEMNFSWQDTAKKTTELFQTLVR